MNASVDEIIKNLGLAYEKYLRLAEALDEALESAHDTKSEPLSIYRLLDELPNFLSDYRIKRLQKSINRIYLNRILNDFHDLFSLDDEVQLTGIYDDETGYNLYRLTFGPLTFDEDGNYIWNGASAIALLVKEPQKFFKFIETFGYHGYDVPEGLSRDALHLLDASRVKGSASIQKLSTEGLIKAIAEISARFSNPGDEDMGSNRALSSIFLIVENTLRFLPLLREAEWSVPISWILDQQR
jgi:hypothetical protein